MISLDNITNIIFDLGGVVIDLEPKLTAHALKKFIPVNFDDFLIHFGQNSLMEQFEIGKISPKEFRDEMRKLATIEVSDKMLDQAWNAMLLTAPQPRLQLLRALRKQYRTFLLSNTNQIHYDAFWPMFQSWGVQSWNELFETAYFSHEIQLRKPNADIFEYVLQREGLKAEQTLFIDDNKPNIEAAKKLGINAVWIERGTELTTLFK